MDKINLFTLLYTIILISIINESSLVVVNGEDKFNFIKLSNQDGYFVSTNSDLNYALILPKSSVMDNNKTDIINMDFTETSYTTVSVFDGNYVTIIDAKDCKKIDKKFDDLGEHDKFLIDSEKKNFLNPKASDKFISIINGMMNFFGNNININSSGSNINIGGTSISISNSYNSNSYSYTSFGNSNYMFAKSYSNKNLLRVFNIKNIITFLYADQKIVMKPANCLNDEEKEILNDIDAEIERIKIEKEKYAKEKQIAKEEKQKMKEIARQQKEREREQREREREERVREKEERRRLKELERQKKYNY